MSRKPALRVSGLNVFYNDFQAIWDVSFDVMEGEVVSLIGANGAGKSTLLNSIGGLQPPKSGTIEYYGERIDTLTSNDVVARGISVVPEGRRIFPRLTVYENLLLGAFSRKDRSKLNETLDMIYELFPILKERGSQMGTTLSGGEQQMLALGRALMSNPRVILCDEISLGLAPVVIKSIYEKLAQISKTGVTIVLVEQDVKRSLQASDRANVMLEGKIVLQGRKGEISESEIEKAYFGI